MKYPIGIQTFEKLREGGYVYVDKTAYVHKIDTTGTVYFLCRPRRFGKSLLLSTIKAYFLGKKDLFKGLAIESLETEWDAHPVFHIDINGIDSSKDDAVEGALSGYINTWAEEYGVKNISFLPIGKQYNCRRPQSHRAMMCGASRRVRQASARRARHGHGGSEPRDARHSIPLSRPPTSTCAL